RGLIALLRIIQLCSSTARYQVNDPLGVRVFRAVERFVQGPLTRTVRQRTRTLVVVDVAADHHIDAAGLEYVAQYAHPGIFLVGRRRMKRSMMEAHEFPSSIGRRQVARDPLP